MQDGGLMSLTPPIPLCDSSHSTDDDDDIWTLRRPALSRPKYIYMWKERINLNLRCPSSFLRLPPLPFTLKMVQSIHSFTSTCTGRVKIFPSSLLSIDEKRGERERERGDKKVLFLYFISFPLVFRKLKRGGVRRGREGRRGKRKVEFPEKQASSVIKTS